ncbi:MAG: D-Ala-D-Ala carboxypeptidase family metallohydrolase [Hyphomicrobiaceae bacterium]
MLFSDSPIAVRATRILGLALAGTILVHGPQARGDEAGEWLEKAITKTETGGYSGLGGPANSDELGSGSVTGSGGIRWVAGADCLNGQLQGVIASIAASYGSVTVSSTCRSRSQNAAAGGAPKSYHLSGDAADFRVHGNWGGAYQYLKANHGGGLKHMGGGLFHIDTGPRRPM